MQLKRRFAQTGRNTEPNDASRVLPLFLAVRVFLLIFQTTNLSAFFSAACFLTPCSCWKFSCTFYAEPRLKNQMIMNTFEIRIPHIKNTPLYLHLHCLHNNQRFSFFNTLPWLNKYLWQTKSHEKNYSLTVSVFNTLNPKFRSIWKAAV